MILELITSQIVIQLCVSCLILVSQHYHQVIHNRGQHGSSRRLNPAGVHYCSRTRSNDPPGGNQTHQAGHSTQPNFSSHQAQSTTCCECTVTQAPHARGPLQHAKRRELLVIPMFSFLVFASDFVLAVRVPVSSATGDHRRAFR